LYKDNQVTIKENGKESKKELVIKQRWTGCLLEMNINAAKVWYMNRVDGILDSDVISIEK
jgi:hypothetical protein